MKIALNIFTNTTSYAPSTEIIERTHASFRAMFKGSYETRIFIDPHPQVGRFRSYNQSILRRFKGIECVKASSLSDAYVKSIQMSNADFLFQLEHDWIFLPGNINHTLEEICQFMQDNGLYHFRFNKRQNIVAKWDKSLKEVPEGIIKYCITPNISNNPHIIDRQKYVARIIRYIKQRPGSKGIEEELNLTGKFFSCIYGGINHPAAVQHIDGRQLDKVRYRGILHRKCF